MATAQRNIKLINAYTVCMNFIFILPVIVPYYNSIGLNFRDFLIGEAVFSACVLAFEIPSGWIADIWNRRGTLMLGAFASVCGFSLLLVADTLAEAIISQGIIGFAVAMTSGAASALMYDSLLQEGRQEEYRRLQGKYHGLGLYAVAAGCLAGGFLYAVHEKLPILLYIVFLSAAMVIMACVEEPQRHRKAVETSILRDVMETMHYALRGHPEIAGIILVSMVIFCTSKLMMWAQQPYFAMMRIPIVWFGLYMAANQMVGGIAGYWSHTIEYWGGHRDKLKWMVVILGFTCLILWGVPNLYICIPLFFTGALAYGMGHPTVQNAINNLVGSERRATILSTASLMVHITTIPTSIIVGAVQDALDIRFALGYLGLQLLILGGIGLWLWKPKDPVRS